MTVEAFDVIALKTGKDCMNLAARHQFRFFDGLFDGVDRTVDIDDDAFAQSLRRVGSDADNFHASVGHFADDGANLRGTDVQTHYDAVFLRHDLVLSPTR